MIFDALGADHYWTCHSVLVPDSVWYLLRESEASKFPAVEWTDGAYRVKFTVAQAINR